MNDDKVVQVCGGCIHYYAGACAIALALWSERILEASRVYTGDTIQDLRPCAPDTDATLCGAYVRVRR